MFLENQKEKRQNQLPLLNQDKQDHQGLRVCIVKEIVKEKKHQLLKHLKTQIGNFNSKNHMHVLNIGTLGFQRSLIDQAIKISMFSIS